MGMKGSPRCVQSCGSLVAPGRVKVLICGGVITSTRKIVYRLHDQAEDEESKSLPIIDTLRNITIVLYKNYK